MEEDGQNAEVVPLRKGTPALMAHLRKNFHAFKDSLFGPEQVEYKTPINLDDDEPMHSPGPFHPGNIGLERKGEAISRPEHFGIGEQEAKIHHINEGKEIRFRREGLYDEPKIDLPYDQEKDPDK